MAEPTGGWVRAARACVAVGLTGSLAGLGHGAGGGGLSPAALLTVVVLLLPVGLLATAVRWTLTRALLGLGLGQVAVHALLTLMAPSAQGYAVSGHRAHGTASLAMAGGHPASALDSLVAPSMTSPTMLAGHAVALVVTAVLLAKGEDALWAVLARLLPTVRAVRIPLPSALVLSAPPTSAAKLSALLHRLRGRAPPALDAPA